MGEKSIKKLSKLGEGTAIFLSKDIKKLGWKQGDYVWVEQVGETLVLRKIKG